MSLYADLRCSTCQRSLWLGKAVFKPDGAVWYFHRESAGGKNSEAPILNRALWRFLADHARHDLKVVVEGDLEYSEGGEYAEVGGDAMLRGDIEFDDYLRGWPG